jgi:hypothetical protein
MAGKNEFAHRKAGMALIFECKAKLCHYLTNASRALSCFIEDLDTLNRLSHRVRFKKSKSNYIRKFFLHVFAVKKTLNKNYKL